MEPVWRPSKEVLQRSNLYRFMRQRGISEYRDLIHESISDPDWYWDAVIADMGFRFFKMYDQVLDAERGFAHARWFVGGTTNVAWNSCHKWAQDVRHRDREAVVFLGEDGLRRSINFFELSREVTRLAEAFVRLGLIQGDRVAIVLPLGVEAVVASHACAHAGLIQVPIFTGFGAEAMAERIALADARIVITTNTTTRRGRSIDLLSHVVKAAERSACVEGILSWGTEEDSHRSSNRVPIINCRDAIAESPGVMPPTELPADHPYLLAFTSGTTGRPKGVIQTHAGFAVTVSAHTFYQCDVQTDDTILFLTDLGWVMGPWTIVGGGFCGARLVFLEGTHDAWIGRLWEAIQAEDVSVLGLSPTVARSLMNAGDSPKEKLASLRLFFSTGECWDEESYDWLFREVGDSTRPIINASGGTEAGVLLTCSIVEPIKPCALGLPAPATDVAVYSANGTELLGEVGELVCRSPWPSLTRGLWKDENRYIQNYWQRFPGVYHHGDWAIVDDEGTWWLQGRSDDTLNIAGKRIGPSEIEAAASEHAHVVQATAIGVPDGSKGETVWLFCTALDGHVPPSEVSDEVADLVARGIGKPFRPSQVIFVEKLPRTQSQKIVRGVLRTIALGGSLGDLSQLEDPSVPTHIAATLQRSGLAPAEVVH